MQLNIKLTVFLLFSFLIPKIKTNSFILKNDFVKLVSYDENFIKITSFNVYKKDRDTTALNVTYVTKIDIVSDEQVKISISALQFKDNEFKKTVVDFSIGICTLYRVNKFETMSLLKNSNLTGCPFSKGAYYINDFAPTASILPRFFPEGKWLINLIFLTYGRKVTHVQWILTVTKKI